jgi:catechol 2,3-dioxygenase-like lactoylglutathione lyase family enzyme
MSIFTLGNGSIQLTNLSHIGIAVKDTAKTIEFLSSFWNIGPPETSDYYPKPAEMIYGEAFAVKLTFVKFGTHTYELLQPLDDKSIWAKFIKEKGEGIHHVAYGVSNYDELVGKFDAAKHKLLVAASFQNCRWCYYDTTPGGIILEFREEYARV